MSMLPTVASFSLPTLRWDPGHRRCEATRLAYGDGPIEINVGYDEPFEAPSLQELWELATAGLSLPGVPAPDYARIEALSAEALAHGFAWGGSYWDGDWSIGLVDEIRGRWHNEHRAGSLEEALGFAVVEMRGEMDWIAQARKGWAHAPAPWLAQAMARAPEATTAPFILKAAAA